LAGSEETEIVSGVMVGLPVELLHQSPRGVGPA
jgi:hypothetical protein